MSTQENGMPLIRLRSMFAESPEDEILFQVSSSSFDIDI